MNDNINKIKTKYLRSVNAINVVSVYMLISTILYLVFERYTIPQILEMGRWSNILGLYINVNKVRYLGTSISLTINLLIAAVFYFLSRKSKQGDLRFYVSFIGIYVIDTLLSVFYIDIYSFILHLVVIAYLIYGHYHYNRLIVEYEKYKKNKKKEEE